MTYLHFDRYHVDRKLYIELVLDLYHAQKRLGHFTNLVDKNLRLKNCSKLWIKSWRMIILIIFLYKEKDLLNLQIVTKVFIRYRNQSNNSSMFAFAFFVTIIDFFGQTRFDYTNIHSVSILHGKNVVLINWFDFNWNSILFFYICPPFWT